SQAIGPSRLFLGSPPRCRAGSRPTLNKQEEVTRARNRLDKWPSTRKGSTLMSEQHHPLAGLRRLPAHVATSLRKHFVLRTLVTVVTLAFVALSSVGAAQSTLNVRMHFRTSTLDPAFNTLIPDRSIIMNIYSALVRYDN